MEKKLKRNNHVKTLKKIEKFIAPFNPPVQAFEKSIRNTPFRILISILLSSRTKDTVTKDASKKLFNIADTPEKILKIGEQKIRELIYPVGFYKRKAKNIYEICKQLIQIKKIPDNFKELINLPGVGRKTANLVLALAFNKPSIAVDTHVFRISKRLGWANGKKPEIIEQELKKMFSETFWNKINQTLVGFGQTVCKPQNPSCKICILKKECPYNIQKKDK
jgi:endonuclease-3